MRARERAEQFEKRAVYIQKEKGIIADKNLCQLWATVRVAEALGAELGRGPLLLRALPTQS